MMIVIDGPDGAGKSTLAWALARKLGAHLTREPFYETTRELLFQSACASPAELAIAMAHDRYQHLRLIEPMLDLGITVVCDRYVLSTLVYQYEALAGLPDRDAVLAFLTAGAREPDLTLVVDVPSEVARARQASKNRDRFEADPDLQARVRARYIQLAIERGYTVLDGSRSTEDLTRSALAFVMERRGRP